MEERRNTIEISADQAEREMDASAWDMAELPKRVWRAYQQEVSLAPAGRPPAVYRAAVECVKRAFPSFAPPKERASTLLDVGAGCAQYKAILSPHAPKEGLDYVACDVSAAFRDFALLQDPALRYDIADARALPYSDRSFDVVFSGGVIMYLHDWPKALAEFSRVSSEWVVLHRTPFVHEPKSKFFASDFHGIRCVHLQFSEAEIMREARNAGLRPMHTQNIFTDGRSGTRSYLMRKG